MAEVRRGKKKASKPRRLRGHPPSRHRGGNRRTARAPRPRWRTVPPRHPPSEAPCLMRSAIRPHLRLRHGAGGNGRGPDPDPRRHVRGAGLEGHRVLVHRDARPAEERLRILAGELRRPEVDEHEVRVRPARDDVVAVLGEPPRERAPVAHYESRVLAEPGLPGASPSATAFAAITCIRGPPCNPGKVALSTAAGMLLAAQHETAAWPSQRLVRRGRHDIRVRDRRWMVPGGHESRDVRHVDHDAGAARLRDLREAREVDLARIGARPPR